MRSQLAQRRVEAGHVPGAAGTARGDLASNSMPHGHAVFLRPVSDSQRVRATTSEWRGRACGRALALVIAVAVDPRVAKIAGT
jgi:hypothetical protein